jgi:ApeA N-terminal domain 1
MIAEGFHRATFSETHSKVDLKSKEVKAWLETFPEHERTMVQSRLNTYLNEPSLGDRLTGLINKAGPAFGVVSSKPTNWAKLVKDMRNSLTHLKAEDPPGSKPPKVDISSSQLAVLAESISLLVSICMLVRAFA